MRIVIDLQGAQSSGSRHSGIGRHSLSLVRAIARNRRKHEVLIALNGLFPDSVEPIRGALNDVLPQENIRVWECPGPVNFSCPDNDCRRRAAELIREAFLCSLQPDVLHVSSLFEGLIDNAISSIGLFTQAVPTALTLYDLLPLIHGNIYLADPNIESWYLSKIGHLRRANLWLAISESSRQEGVSRLGLPAAWTVNVSTAVDPAFRCVSVPNDVSQRILRRYGLGAAFILYAGGNDPRKNIEGLIRSFARLPRALLEQHQLAIVCSINPDGRRNLEQLAKECGLKADRLVLTGFVSDGDLALLYNMCKVFVFPSWHEGFGLPALEAMTCGAPTIAANSSSLPELIAWDDALFDPHSEESISSKIAQVLRDAAFRNDLVQHGLAQAEKFSWDESARRALVSFERLYAKRLEQNVLIPAVFDARRPKLAYISPLPPSRSGQAIYSAELLPELACHYEVEVIVSQSEVADPWVRANCRIRTPDWFVQNANRFDRVLYHFGNSDDHAYMFELLARIPGVIVLHDFFLSSIVLYMDRHSIDRNAFSRELYRAHGYAALRERFHATDTEDVVRKFPCNLGVLRSATGVIVHSEHSLRLADEWYGPGASSSWRRIPHLRSGVSINRRHEARERLSLPPEALLVCSFGSLGPRKQNHRLLHCWLNSSLAANPACFLVFVGENDHGRYGTELADSIRSSKFANRIRITGWLDIDGFKSHLAATDIAVQLRTQSRGETSSTVLDCMNYGVPTIVNAHGAMAELDPDSVLTLADEFEDSELITALQTLGGDEPRRVALGERAREVIRANHSPRDCAYHYFEAIETFQRQHSMGRNALIQALARSGDAPSERSYLLDQSTSIARSIGEPCRTPQLFVDVSELVLKDAKTGIQRVVRGILAELLLHPPTGFRVEPVYACRDRVGYCYARHFTMEFLNCPDREPADAPVEAFPRDVFLGLDLQPVVVPRHKAFFAKLRSIGVKVHFVVYDLLPLLLPHYFEDGSTEDHVRWLRTVEQGDGAMCISRTVADELLDWLTVFGTNRCRPFQVGWFHLGASMANTGFETEDIHRAAKSCVEPVFLMVGTVEPRKGHGQVLDAFELLWRDGVNATLMIVGKRGWMVDSLVRAIRSHSELGLRLQWLESTSDAQLAQLYSTSTCLIAASEGEGFGLPLIEAAAHRLPIIARDIPVFREVAGEHALYFSGDSASSLANAVLLWLQLNECGSAPRSELTPMLTWASSARQLVDGVLHNQWYRQWMPSINRRFWGSDPRLATQVGRRMGRHMVSNGVAGWMIHGPYIELKPGIYRVVIGGNMAGDNGTQATIEITVEQGYRVLARSPVHKMEAEGTLASLGLRLDDVATDLEVRVWVNDGSVVTVYSVEIQPVLESELIVDAREDMYAERSKSELRANQTPCWEGASQATTVAIDNAGSDSDFRE